MYKDVIVKSMRDVFENYQSIIKAILIPFVLLLVIHIVSLQFIKVGQFGFINILFVLLSLLVDMIILISIHRILILGSDSIPTWGIGRYTKREIRFLLKYLGLFFLIFIVLFFTVFIFSISQSLYIFFVFFVLVSIIFSRLSLVFPASAIDDRLTFVESWRVTKNYKLLTFVSIVLFPILFSIVVGGIYSLVIGYLVNTISSYLSFLYIPLNIVITVFLVSALSNTYMYIIYHTEKENYTEKQVDCDD